MITATDPDHLDIYGTKEAYLESFRKYTSLIQPGGALIVRKGIELQPALQNGVKLYTYSQEEGDFHAENIRIGNGEIFFDYVSPLGNIPNIQLGVPVSINIENGVAAMALAQMSGLTDEEIKRGMASFRGVDRRFDFKIKNDKGGFPERLCAPSFRDKTKHTLHACPLSGQEADGCFPAAPLHTYP